MATTSNTLNVTANGLIQINQKLLNVRKYDSSLIETIGTPIVNNGVARDFSPSSYFFKNEFTFEHEDVITIGWSGTYYKEPVTQCLWSLASDNDSFLVTAKITEDELLLYIGDTPISTFPRMAFPDGTFLSLIVKIKPTEINVSLIYGDELFTDTITLSENLPIETYDTVYIGFNPLDPLEYWRGSIQLTDFTINRNGELIFTPSVGPKLKFSKVLVGDGEFPLKDGSFPVINHIYEFPVTEVTRSGSTVLLLTEVSSDAYLLIRQIGLYIETDKGDLLFSLIDNLNIRKTADLDYDLIFTLDVSIGFANVVGFPEHSFIVQEPEYAKFKDLLNVEYIFNYILTNMERLIIQNAQMIGYNREQVFYRLQNQIELWENNFSALQNYEKLQNRFTKSVEYSFNPEAIGLEGTPTVTNNGEASDFTESDYITIPVSPDTTSWHGKAAFEVPEDTQTKQSIMCFGSRTKLIPMQFSIENGYCTAYASEEEKLHLLYKGNPVTAYRSPQSDLSYDRISWYSPDTVEDYNLHVAINGSNLQIHGPSISGFSTNDYAHTGLTLGNIWKITTNFTTGEDIGTLQYILGCTNHDGVEIFIEDGYLKANVYKNSLLLIDGLTIGTPLIEESTYYASLSYNGTDYVFEYSLDSYTESISDTNEGISGMISTRFGVTVESSSVVSPFLGSINLAKTQVVADEEEVFIGAFPIDYIITSNNIYYGSDPAALTFSDSSGYPIIGNTFNATSFEYGTILEENLFEVTPGTKYYLKWNFDGNFYQFFLSENGEDYEQVLSIRSVEKINVPTKICDGVSYDGKGSQISISDPFAGTIYLMDTELSSYEGTWAPVNAHVIQGANLVQFYHIPVPNTFHTFKIYDLKDRTHELESIDKRFTGNGDLINLSYSDGFTLMTKVHLKDLENKIILCKSDRHNNIYFLLELVDSTISFKLYLPNRTEELVKEISLQEYNKFIEYPILLTITYNGQPTGAVFSMYRNNDLLTQTTTYLDRLENPSTFYLTNYIDYSLNTELYVSDIIFLSGVISAKDLYYVNNLMDTNY